ncbi:MAG: S1/P1 nuclease [Pirellulaceae bacterium]
MQGVEKALFVWLLLLLTLWAEPLRAWSEAGHHIIGVMAFELLTAEEQQRLLARIEQHPRFPQDFRPPESVREEGALQRWRVGRLAFWPDIARNQPEFHRSTWHYELGATLILGSENDVRVPTAPGTLPTTATLDTQELYIAQAVDLCRRVAADPQAPVPDRALALSWLGHLVADAHQPCHAGSLYAAGIFPDGDRGANGIPVKQGYNLHYLWDALLGNRFDAGDTRRRIDEITRDSELAAWGRGAVESPDGLEPQTWLTESRQQALVAVYTPLVRETVTTASRGLTTQLTEIDLPADYLRQAGRVAQQRASQAAYRLAAVWREALTPRD